MPIEHVTTQSVHGLAGPENLEIRRIEGRRCPIRFTPLVVLIWIGDKLDNPVLDENKFEYHFLNLWWEFEKVHLVLPLYELVRSCEVSLHS